MPFSLDVLAGEADGRPYVLTLDGGRSLTIARPEPELLRRWASVNASTRVRLGWLAGDAASDLIDALSGEDVAVLQVVEDHLGEFFGAHALFRLDALMERYGQAITADLAFAGWDAIDLYERGRWAFMLSMVDHLPRTSAFSAAVADDDDLAAQRELGVSGRSTPPLTEWDPSVELLAAIFDRLGDVANAPFLAAGGKAGRVQPWPRPVTAWHRVQAARLRDEADSMAARLWPDGGES